MEKTYKKVILLVRDEEINLNCPICGCDEFSDKELIVQEPLKLLPTNIHYYICRDCAHAVSFVEPKEKPATPKEKAEAEVEELEGRFKNYSESKLRKIIESDDYFDAAKKAASNLLKRK